MRLLLLLLLFTILNPTLILENGCFCSSIGLPTEAVTIAIITYEAIPQLMVPYEQKS